jgi:hypothetical protein
VVLLKELLWLIAGRGGNDDDREAKGGDKVNLVFEGGNKVNLGVALPKEIFISIIKYFLYFNFFNQKNEAHNCHLSIMFIKLMGKIKFSNRIRLCLVKIADD